MIDEEANGGAFPGTTVDLEHAVKFFRPPFQIGQAIPPADGGRVEANAIVFDDEMPAVALFGNRDFYRTGLGMAGDIAQDFFEHTKDILAKIKGEIATQAVLRPREFQVHAPEHG